MDTYPSPSIVEYIIEPESVLCASTADEKPSYEQFFSPFIQTLDSLPPSERKGIMNQKFISKKIYNVGVMWLKLIWIDNTSQVVSYMTNLDGVVFFRFNLYELLYPFVGSYLQVKSRKLVPVDKIRFKNLYPYLNALLNDERVIVLADEGGLSGKALYIGLLPGPFKHFSNMELSLFYLQRVFSWYYQLAKEIYTSDQSPAEAKTAAKNYMRTLHAYKQYDPALHVAEMV